MPHIKLALALLFFAGVAYPADYSLSSARPAQGQVLKIYSSGAANRARIGSLTIKLFPQADGRLMGLLPIAVLTKPGPARVEWLGAGDAVIHTELITVRNAHFATQNIVLSKALSNLKSSPAERVTVGQFLNELTPDRYWQEPFQLPIPGCETSPFGVMRLHNGKPTGDYHAGLDQRGALGTPVHPVTAGVVRIAEQLQLRGGTVAVDHGQGLQSIYLHMSQVEVKPGQHVTPADTLGLVGSTGRSTGPHLHWTLYAYAVPINPLQWVSAAPCKAAKP